jgi:polysaccharide export outer membrane protein
MALNMKTPSSGFVLIIMLLFLTASCVTKKHLTYLQFSGGSAAVSSETGDRQNSVTPAAYKVMPHDNLYIRVITPDPQWSELFNSMPVGVGGSLTEESAGLFGYSVDESGMIEIPFVGKVEVGGHTLSEIKTELDSIFRGYVTDAAITIRLVNNFISIIGEVNLPGRYPIMRDRINVFEALSMAGDMTTFGDRQRIKLIRPSPYGPIIKEFSLADRSIFSSEFYYIMPNDIIYAIPMKGRAFEVNSTIWTLLLSTITSTLGVIAFFRTL